MPDSNNKTVVFLLPNGEEVSNDPRFMDEKYREHLLSQTENTGNAVDVKFIETEFNQEPSDPSEDRDIDLEEMTIDQLKNHIKELRANGVLVDTKGVKTRTDLIEAIVSSQTLQETE